MATGKVDFFNDTGGYGFIETDDADDDVFFHMEDVEGPDLEEGQELEFDIESSPRDRARPTSFGSKPIRYGGSVGLTPNATLTRDNKTSARSRIHIRRGFLS